MRAITPHLPAEVLAGVRTRWPDRADPWAERIDAELHELCTRYDATPRRVMPARYGYVLAVDTPDGGLVMRATPDPHGPTQAQVAAALADVGISPTVHESIVTDTGTWTILDEVRPGTPLSHTDRSIVSLDALIAPLTAIAGRPAPIPAMPSLTDWIRQRLEDDNLTDLPPRATVAPATQRRDALRILDELSHDSVPELCHGDASPPNYLAAGPNQWVLIDPRGIAGEATYDLAVLGLKLAAWYPPDTYLNRLTDSCTINTARVKAWMTVAHAARV
jgi:streptomycin 6-kinase